MTQKCLSHRLCYINFDQFQDQGKHLQGQVQKTTATIKGFLDTLDSYYKQVGQLDDKINVLRLKVMKKQQSRKDYELDKKAVQLQIVKSQKELTTLSYKFQIRQTMWQKRIDTLTERITKEEKVVQSLGEWNDKFYEEIKTNVVDFKGKYPNCYEQIKPMLSGIFQLQEYYKTLNRDDTTLDAFRSTVKVFKEFYMTNILIKNVGTDEAAKVNFADLPHYLMKMIATKEDQIQRIH
jgi:chromosome segregation ATPase